MKLHSFKLPQHHWNRELRWKLVSFIVLVVLPLTGFQGLGLYSHYQQSLRLQVTRERELADTFATAFANYVTSIWNIELALGGYIADADGSLPPAEIRETLLAQLATDPTLSALAWVSPTGDIVVSTDQRWQGRNVADKAYFAELINGKESTLSDLLIIRETGEQLFSISRATRRDGQLVGVVVAGMQLKHLDQILPTGARQTGEQGLIDRQGRSMYLNGSPDTPFDQRRLPDGSPCWQTLATHTPMTTTPDTWGTDPFIGACSPVPSLGWAAFSFSERDQALGSIRAMTRRYAPQLAMVATLPIALAFVLATRWLRPVRSLRLAVHAVAAGDLNARAQVTGTDELSNTNLLFNRMAASVQQAQSALHRRAEEAAVIAHLSQRKLEGTSLDQIFQEAAEQITGTLNLGCCHIVKLAADGVSEVQLAQAYRHRPLETTLQCVRSVPDPQHCTGTRALTVPIPGAAGLFGHIDVCTCRHAMSSPADRQFIETVAALLDTTIRREWLERGRSTYLAVAGILAEATTLAAAVPELLSGLCGGFAFDVGIFWAVASNGTALHAAGYWHPDPEMQERLQPTIAGIRLAPNVDGPGIAWVSRRLDWCADTPSRAGSPRADLRKQLETRTAVNVPVFVGDEVIAVIELACREPRRYDGDLAAMLTAVGAHVGQYIKREQIQRQLVSSNEQLRALVKASPAPIITSDLEHRIIGWNPAAERLSGWSEAEVLGTKIPVTTRRHERNALFVPSPSDAAPPQSQVISQRRKDGTKLDLSVLTAPWRTPDGKTFGRLIIVSDITDRIRFLRIAAHELRNPLAGVRSLLSLVQRKLTSNKPDRVPQLLSVLSSEVDRLTKLVNDIFTAFLAEQGGMTLRRVPLRLGQLLEEAVTPFRLLGEREIAFSQHKSVQVLGDAERLHEVFRNLLSNATKYSPTGSPIQIDVQSVVSDRVRVAVRDQGLGIPPEDMPHLFDTFFRGSNLSGRDPGGMGLGLAICREIVHLHGGRIWAECMEGKGSTFYVELPVLAENTGGDSNDGNGTFG